MIGGRVMSPSERLDSRVVWKMRNQSQFSPRSPVISGVNQSVMKKLRNWTAGCFYINRVTCFTQSLRIGRREPGCGGQEVGEAYVGGTGDGVLFSPP